MTWKDKPLIRTALAVQRRYGEDGAGYLAAAITYYGFLSLFPLLLVALSALGFVLAADASAQREWADRLSGSIPGLEPLIGRNLDALIDARGATGLLGIAGLLWTGRGVANATGHALSRIFRVRAERAFLKDKIWSLGTTLLLGVLALTTVVIAGVVTNLSISGPAGVAVTITGGLVAFGLDVFVFAAAYRLLTPRPGPDFNRLWRGAVLAATGWTVLKLVGGWYATRLLSQSSAAYGTFATAAATLLLLYLASQLFLYGAELNAVLIGGSDRERIPRMDGAYPRRSRIPRTGTSSQSGRLSAS